jgi:broad specificity phosphatase PhoE
LRDIYLIRHGETEWNVAGRFQGKLDSSLTSAGTLQAKAIADKLADLNIQADSFVASPLGRTRQTASIIANRTILPNLLFDDRLAEVSVGSWDGLTHYDIDAQWPGLLDGSTHFDWFFKSPDGERYEEAFKRAKNWLDSTSGVAVAVSHGLMGRIIRGVYLDLSKNEMLGLPVPQDVIWRLSGNTIEQIRLD